MHRISIPFISILYSLPAIPDTSILQSLLHVQRLDIPNALGILVNTPITGEEAHACNGLNGLGDPFILVLVGFVDQGVGFDVAVEVIADEVVVAVVGDGTSESGESTSITKGS